MERQEAMELFTMYQGMCPDALYMNHYELQAATMIPSATWKELLQINEIANWVKSELKTLRQAELAKITQDVSESKSVGQAQLITALQKVDSEQNVKVGPAFVYCYVPLDVNQEKADNVKKLDKDPFMKE